MRVVSRGIRCHRVLRLATAVVLALTAGGCAPSSSSGGSARPPKGLPAPMSTSPAMPSPASCQAWGCRARQSLALRPGWTLRLWLSPNRMNPDSRPIVELIHADVDVQWWISPRGDGWNGSLTCRPHRRAPGGPAPNCVLIDSLGMHAQLAEMLILRGGRLVHPAHGEAISNTVGMRAADLDLDGYLDVLAVTNDYRPNFAQGNNYWQTFRYHRGQLSVTGCARQASHPAPPTRLLTGGCPTT